MSIPDGWYKMAGDGEADGKRWGFISVDRRFYLYVFLREGSPVNVHSSEKIEAPPQFIPTQFINGYTLDVLKIMSPEEILSLLILPDDLSLTEKPELAEIWADEFQVGD